MKANNEKSNVDKLIQRTKDKLKDHFLSNERNLYVEMFNYNVKQYYEESEVNDLDVINALKLIKFIFSTGEKRFTKENIPELIRLMKEYLGGYYDKNNKFSSLDSELPIYLLGIFPIERLKMEIDIDYSVSECMEIAEILLNEYKSIENKEAKYILLYYALDSINTLRNWGDDMNFYELKEKEEEAIKDLAEEYGIDFSVLEYGREYKPKNKISKKDAKVLEDFYTAKNTDKGKLTEEEEKELRELEKQIGKWGWGDKKE